MASRQGNTFNIEGFVLENYLGHGGFGHVFKYSSKDKSNVAVKKLPFSSETFDVADCREIQTMMKLTHPNIVKYLGYCNVDLQVALVMEFCAGDLDHLITSPRAFREEEVAFLMSQVCHGLAYLHKNGTIHRDIKPGSILISCETEMDIHLVPNVKEMVLKISGFGLSKLLNEDVTSETMTVVGTPLYEAPELRDALTRNLRYSMRTDVYSLGLVAYNLLRKDLHKLMPGIGGVGAVVLRRESKITTLFTRFLSSCLQQQPSNRHSSDQLLRHPFIQKIQLQNIGDTIQEQVFNIERYQLKEFLGRGSYGDVNKYSLSSQENDAYKDDSLSSQEDDAYKDVAVKKLGIKAIATDGSNFHVKSNKEIQIMMNLRHPNVVRFLGYCKIDFQIAVVMELCLGDADKLIEIQRMFSEDEVAFFTNQLCQSLAYLHRNGIIHRDIKPGNILIKCSNEIDLETTANIREIVLKISDFGASKQLVEDATSVTMTVAGSPLYMAPELREALSRNLHYSMRSDVYSMGLVSYNIMKKDLHNLKLGPGGEGFEATILGNDFAKHRVFKSFLGVCLQYQPGNRHTSAQLLQHPFLSTTIQGEVFNIDRFSLKEFMGRGSYGDVYKYSLTSPEAADGSESIEVAVKKLGIAANYEDGNNSVITDINEIQIMMVLSHQNVLRFLGYCKVDFQIALVMEICLGDLGKIIGSKRIFKEIEAAYFINQMCQGLAYLHKNGIIHRDIKPGNILIKCPSAIDFDIIANFKEIILKISDFGLSKQLAQNTTSAIMSVAGTPTYMAPELKDAVTRNLHYSMKSDVYSLGLVSYNLMHKDLHKIKLHQGVEGAVPLILKQGSNHSIRFNSFLAACLQHESERRDTSAKLLEHPFLEEALLQNMDGASPWSRGGICTALHYSRPSKMIIGMADGKLIIYDMRAKTKNVKSICEASILSIHSNDSFIAVGSGDPKAPVVILNKEDHKIAKVLINHTTHVQCIQMSNEFLVTVGDDEKMFVYGIPGWNVIAEETRDGFARYQCATIAQDILTVIDNKRVKQYKLTNVSCEETLQHNVKEQLYSIAPHITQSNVFWVGTSKGALKKVNPREKSVLDILQMKEGKQVFQIKQLDKGIICLQGDPKTRKFGPAIAYNDGGLYHDIPDLSSGNIFGPLETSDKWLAFSDGEKLVFNKEAA